MYLFFFPNVFLVLQISRRRRTGLKHFKWFFSFCVTLMPDGRSELTWLVSGMERFGRGAPVAVVISLICRRVDCQIGCHVWVSLMPTPENETQRHGDTETTH